MRQCPAIQIVSAKEMWVTSGNQYWFEKDYLTADASKGTINFLRSGEKTQEELPKASFENGVAFWMAMMVCALCNNSSYNFDSEKEEFVSVGDPTEVGFDPFCLR